jgi:hypothetical protein
MPIKKNKKTVKKPATLETIAGAVGALSVSVEKQGKRMDEQGKIIDTQGKKIDKLAETMEARGRKTDERIDKLSR